MSGSIKLPHVCPKCGEKAKTALELQEKFGYRTIPSNKVTNQSYCKKCR
ncbi:hypothetical protein [Histophilus somni]|uniref:Uncharacterized protein n=1 Tax=Histophilus somni TaxID=731 RepID=A0A9Q6Z1N9_HISSO|nr:hypothetical protein [Histophilus somni]MBB5152292.1 hypothetical protein [Histophilus somni]QQF72850.1 hypothetical protein JFL50_03135 [Histophilus somni]QQF76583.1 hypothetical protein JFL52_06995 [Histophilus somni]QQF82905.1 hypothetical protein JFL49_03080 [Histophilus somni]QQF85579.1 hypothetical protein JFL55_07225 [Histophilus somni]